MYSVCASLLSLIRTMPCLPKADSSLMTERTCATCSEYTVTVCVAEYRNSAPSPLLHCWADLSMIEGGETVISLEAIPLSLRNALILLVFSSMDLYNA